ncbi:tyrosine-type recombinase/integrase [Catellatospora citrea]|uniref:site-specific integrase n=1 Tax=Catellatospora citrea TaxID=53366 RepID=UPI0033E39D5C
MSDGTFSKRCGCRDQRTKKPLGAQCPKLRRKDGSWHPDHGTYRYQMDLPASPRGERRLLRRSGFDTREAAVADRDHAKQLLSMAGKDKAVIEEMVTMLLEAKARAPLPDLEQARERVSVGVALDGGSTFAEYLSEWLKHVPVDPNTLRGYRTHVYRYLIPYLGHVKLGDFKLIHVQQLFTHLDERNETIIEARNSPDKAVRDSVRGVRTLSKATYRRIRATLSTAMTRAVSMQLAKENRVMMFKIHGGGRPKARVWTAERVAAWRATGAIPSPVMVWTPAQTAQFLDFVADDPLYALFHIIAMRGLRRGEAVGLRRMDLDLANYRMVIVNQIAQHGWEPVEKAPKTGAGDRVLALDDDSHYYLVVHLSRQNALRELRGDAWHDSGMVFTDTQGNAWHPAAVTDRFNALVKAADMPPIRLHDLRHGAASIAHASGSDIKSISSQLGHSGIAITADTYTEVFAEVDRDAANAAAAMIRRARDRSDWPMDLGPAYVEASEDSNAVD